MWVSTHVTVFERGDKLGLKASKFQRKEKSMYSIRKLIRTESLMFNFFYY